MREREREGEREGGGGRRKINIVRESCEHVFKSLLNTG